MAETKKRAVGLIILTEIPARGGLVAVLQRRGLVNHEKDWNNESFPGACQVTVHGELEGVESFTEALEREVLEELGEEFQAAVYNSGKMNGFKLIVRVKTDRKEVETFGLFVQREILNLVRLGPSTGGLRFVTRNAEISDLNEFRKDDGVTHSSIVAMFPDEIEAVRKAFEIFSP